MPGSDPGPSVLQLLPILRSQLASPFYWHDGKLGVPEALSPLALWNTHPRCFFNVNQLFLIALFRCYAELQCNELANMFYYVGPLTLG